MAPTKEILTQCPACSLYNQTPLLTWTNLKGTQRNDIWQMDAFHITEYGKLKYVYHTIHPYLDFNGLIL